MISFLDDSELEQMRSDVLRLLPDVCDILEGTETSDGQGGFSTVWTAVQAGIQCRIDPSREQSSQVVASSIQSARRFIVTLPYGTQIDDKNRIQIKGNTYSIIGQDSGKSWAISARIAVEQVF